MDSTTLLIIVLIPSAGRRGMVVGNGRGRWF